MAKGRSLGKGYILVVRVAQRAAGDLLRDLLGQGGTAGHGIAIAEPTREVAIAAA